MQVNINNVSEVLQEAEIEVSNEELHPHFEQAYQKFRPKAELKGFRKGKVPMAMIKQLYGEAIEADALDDIAGELYQQAMEERKIQPIGRPSLVDMDFKRGERLRFKIKYEVKPEIALKSYKGIKVEKPVHTITDTEVQEELDHLRRANSTTVPAGKVADRDFVVTGDVQELDETGAPLIGKKSPNTRFPLSDNELAPEIREALMNAEPGQTIRVQFESAHGDHTHTVRAAIAVTKIEKVELPPFDEAFVRKITRDKESSTEEFLTKLRADLARYWEEQSNAKVQDELIDEIVRTHEFLVPDALVDAILDSYVDDLKSRTGTKELPKGFDEQKFRNEGKAHAVRQAKWMLLKEKIAEVEHIAVSDTELEELAGRDAARIGLEKDRLLQYYCSSGSAAERLLSDKILTFLRDHAKIKEKSI